MKKNIFILIVGLLFMVGCENVNISAEVQAPIAKNDSIEVISGQSMTFDVLSNDTDDGALDKSSVKLVKKPTHGTATVTDTGKVTFVANSDYLGADRLTYTVKDDNGNVSNEAIVAITIVAKKAPVKPTPHTNKSPIANNDHFSVTQNSTIVMDILKNDVDSDGSINTTSINLIATVAHGSMTISGNGFITYKSYTGYTGLDFFKYSVKDNEGAFSNIATVYINVYAAQNVLSIAKNDVAEVVKGSSVVIHVLDNDSNGSENLDKSSVVIVQKPKNGSTFLSTTNGTITYVANNHFVGSDFFTYKIKNDKGVLSNEAKVTVTVKEVVLPHLVKSQGPEKKAKEWYVRIVVEDTTNHMTTADAQLGELDTSDVVTKYALKALAPFSTSSFLDVVFKNPVGLTTGEYKSNFHPYSTDAQSWEFTVKSSDSNATMILSWRGLYVLTPYVDSEDREQYKEYRSLQNPLLSYMTLVDMTTNQELKVIENNQVQTYVFEMNGSTQRTFQWRLKDSTVPLASPLLATTPTPYTKTLKALQIKALRKDMKATPDKDKKRRVEQLDMLTPPTFKVLVQ